MNERIIKIAIIEDLPEVLEDLAEIISEQDDLICQCTYRNAEDAITFLPRSDVHIVIVDIGLPGKSGIECVRQIKDLRPDIQFMMYTVLSRDDKLFEALRAGASGYLLKTSNEEKIISAIKDLANGGAPMSSSIARRITDSFFIGRKQVKEMKLLSKREQEILELLSTGLLYKEIASDLEIQTSTVKRHVYNIYQKLHVSNKTEAINLYLGRG